MHRRYEPSNIPIELLRSFVSILDTGSINKAGERLDLSQPAISGHMKRLQALVGESLFDREAHISKLTARGEQVCAYARRILALNDQILAGRSPAKWRIALPSSLSGRYLQHIKATLTSARIDPVQIVCDRSDALLRRSQEGHFDAVVAFSAHREERTPAVAWQENLVWVCHPKLSVGPGAPLPLLSWPETVPDQIAMEACRRAGTEYEQVMIADQVAVLLEAVQFGLGYFCMAERAVPKGLRIATEKFLPALPRMHAGIYKSSETPSAKADKLVSCLAAVLAPDSSKVA